MCVHVAISEANSSLMDIGRVLKVAISDQPAAFAQLGVLGVILQRHELAELLRSGLGGQHFLWTAGACMVCHGHTEHAHTARAHVHARMHAQGVWCVCLAAPLGDAKFESMPRPFDLFAAMKSSDVGGLVELRKMYVCCGYMYSFDLYQTEEGTALKDLIKPTCCSVLGVQLKCFGAGFARKTVESISAKGKAALEEEGLPIVAVDLNTTDIFRVRRIEGLFCSCMHSVAHTMPTHVHVLNCTFRSVVHRFCRALPGCQLCVGATVSDTTGVEPALFHFVPPGGHPPALK